MTATIEKIAVLIESDAKADFYEACALFAAIDDDEEYEIAAKRFPGMVNLDAKGNWIGPVRNENGWTGL